MNGLSRLCVLTKYILHCKSKRTSFPGELAFFVKSPFWQMVFQNAKVFLKKEKKESVGGIAPYSTQFTLLLRRSTLGSELPVM